MMVIYLQKLDVCLKIEKIKNCGECSLCECRRSTAAYCDKVDFSNIALLQYNSFIIEKFLFPA